MTATARQVNFARMRNAASHSHEERNALLAGIGAFGFWGIIPVYWKFLAAVPPSEILAHRFVWTTLFLVILLSWQRRWPEVRAAMASRRTMLFCLASGIAISLNWL